MCKGSKLSPHDKINNGEFHFSLEFQHPLYKSRKRGLAAFRYWFLQQILAFYVLEVPIGTYFQFIAGSIVANDDAMRMELEGGNSPHVVDTSLNSGLKGTALSMAVDQNHHLAGCHNGSNANGQGCLWYLVHITIEEAAVGNDSVSGQGLLTGTAAQ